MAIAHAFIDPAAMATPAVFTNRFLVATVGGAYVRIAFAEATELNTVFYRTAVMMTAADARQLALSILNVLAAPPDQPS